MSESIKQSGGKQNLRTYNMNRTAVFNAMLEDYRDLCRHNPTQAIAEITDRLNQRTFDNAPMFEVSFRVLLAEAHDKKENYVCAAREIELAQKVYRAASDAKEEGTDTEAWGNLETIMTELNDLMKASEGKHRAPLSMLCLILTFQTGTPLQRRVWNRGSTTSRDLKEVVVVVEKQEGFL